MDLSNRLKILMQKRGIDTITELSRKTSFRLTPQAIGKILKGLEKPSARSVEVLADTLETSADYLIFGREPNEGPKLSRGKRNILFVDDQMMSVAPYAEILRREGYSVTLVPSAQEAIRELQSSQFHLGIFDIFLNPSDGPDGTYLLHLVKSRMYDFPVIIISGFPSVQAVKVAYEEGACTFLQKPVSLDELIVTVDRTIDRRVTTDPRRFGKLEICIPPNESFEAAKNSVV